ADEPRVRLVPAGRDGEALDVLMRRHDVDAGDPADRGDILWRECAVGRRLRRTDRDELSVDVDDVAAEPLNAGRDLLLRPRADRRDGDQGSDADDDAECSQRRAKPVRTECRESDPPVLEAAGHPRAPAAISSPINSSLTTCPSASRRIRDARSATSLE